MQGQDGEGLVSCVKELRLDADHRESLKGFKKGGAMSRFAF